MALVDIFAAVRWWAVLMVLGTAVFPFLSHILHRLPDRGYTVSKLAGMLIVSYFFWLGNSFTFLNNTVGGMVAALLLLVALSVWANKKSDWRGWLKENMRLVIFSELLFLGLFFLWVWARSQNPSITGTEKPMEFAFLNSIGRSASFPPADPWLSGFSISYYYFGYVMVSVIGRLAAVPEAIGFNLALAHIVALTGVGAFGLVRNLIKLTWEKAGLSAVIMPLLAAIAVPLAGNGQMLLELLHKNGLGSNAFWAWLNIKDIATPAVVTPDLRFWWFWRSSRVINEYTLNGAETLEPIVEFPGFSFILGDLHPHVLALPFVFLSLSVALAWWLCDFKPNERVNGLQWTGAGLPLLLFTVLTVGGLSFLNTWDVIVHLFIVVGAFYINFKEQNEEAFRETLIFFVSLIGLCILFYLPFYIGFRSQAGAPFLLPMVNRPTRMAHFLVIFGLPLLMIVPFLLTVFLRRGKTEWKSAVSILIGFPLFLFVIMFALTFLIGLSPASMGRLGGYANSMGIDIGSGNGLGWAVSAAAKLIGGVIKGRVANPWVTVLLATIIGAIGALLSGQWAVESREWRVESEEKGSSGKWKVESGKKDQIKEVIQSPNLPISQSPANPIPFLLLLLLTGTLLTIGTEFLFLADNFGQRMNTMFKFYYQTWALWHVVALFGLAYLWHEQKAIASVVSLVGLPLFIAALAFPVFGIQSRTVEFRGDVNSETRRAATLDGLAYLEPNERAAVEWLANQPADVVTVEATGGQYSSYGRFSANSGVPTLLGWKGHEYQWRGDTPEPDTREFAIESIYNSRSVYDVASLLNEYGVDYIVIGQLERDTYTEIGLNKFTEGLLPIAYENPSVTIYRWEAQ